MPSISASIGRHLPDLEWALPRTKLLWGPTLKWRIGGVELQGPYSG